MKKIILWALLIMSIKANAQCESNATKQEALDFINKVVSQNAFGHANEMYSDYRVSVVDNGRPRLVIKGLGFIPSVEVLKIKKDSGFEIMFDIPIEYLSGTVNLSQKNNYIRVELTTERGDNQITDVFTNTVGPVDKKMSSKAYVLIKNNPELADRLKKAIEHLLCLYGRKKDKF